MFDKYSERARFAVFFGLKAAQRLGARTLEPEHILLGLLDEGLAAPPLLPADARDAMRAAVAANLRHGPEHAKELPLSKPLRAVFRHAERAAASAICTGHLVLGLLLEESAAAQVMRAHGMTAEAVRAAMEASPADCD